MDKAGWIVSSVPRGWKPAPVNTQWTFVFAIAIALGGLSAGRPWTAGRGWRAMEGNILGCRSGGAGSLASEARQQANKKFNKKLWPQLSGIGNAKW